MSAMGVGTRADVLACRADMAAAAQGAYDEWQQDADGFDEVLGEGGACDVVAERMLAVLAARLPDMPAGAEYVEADCHTVIVARADDGVLRVNIPAGVYETGMAYRWRKIPNVAIAAEDVDVDVLSADPDDHWLFASDADPAPGPQR